MFDKGNNKEPKGDGKMCIAIVKPKDKVIPKEILKTCCENNPDGMGFAFCKDNNIYIRKYLKDFEKFYKEYSKVETTSPMLIHFRIATHGGVNIENCHPFVLNSRMALIHNGIISGYGDKEKKSDTRDFIDRVIGNISHKQWKNASFRELVGNAIGYSKFGILDTQGNLYIINENKGYWTDGVWYSNKSYEPKKVITTTYKKNEDDTTSYNWYKEKKYKSHFKCEHCGKTFLVDGYTYYSKCPHCGKYSCDNIGYQIDGKDYMYDEDYKDLYCYQY